MAAKDVAAHQLARIHSATTAIVAEHGYEALKVRDVVSYAEVSTRAFYELFSSKEDCFLRTYELISRRATRRMIAAQTGEPDWRKRSQLIFEEFLRSLAQKPEDARLTLVEAYAAGEASLEQAWRAERIFEGMVAECFARAPSGVVVPPLIVEGMVAGIAGVSRNRLLAGKLSDLQSVSQELLDWALCFPDEATRELESLDRGLIWRDTTLEPLPGPSGGGGNAFSATGDRALILAAAAELAAAKGYASLTAPRIRSAAHVSRRKFDSYFDGVEDCYLAALEQHAGAAMAQASRAQAAASTQTGGTYRAIAALSEQIANDPLLFRVCLTNDFPPGPDGTRARQRLHDAAVELLAGGHAPSHLSTEASTSAVWSLFNHHVIRNRASRRQIAASLAYLATAPMAGPSAVVTAIQSEQNP